MSNRSESGAPYLSRRDFLKLSTLVIGGFAMTKVPLEKVFAQGADEKLASPELSGITGQEIEKMIVATRIPVLRYHYPGYEDGAMALPREFFESQMEYLTSGGYRTILDKEFSEFLEGKGSLQAKTAVLRIDQGADQFEEFEKMVEHLKAKGLTAMVFVTTGEKMSDTQWKKLAGWQKEGVIGLGSHSVSHADFRKINYATALAEARISKRTIEEKLAQYGVTTEVISFAFPSDSLPDKINFLKEAGYKYCLGGNLFGVRNNSARPGMFITPSLLPYVSRKLLKITKANEENNPRAYVLSGGLTFDEMMRANTTPITVSEVERVLKLKKPYLPISFGKFTELPTTEEQKGSLVRPAGIIIHTDDQGGDDYADWVTKDTYSGLLLRDFDTHFGVGVDGVAQFLPMYRHFCTPTRGGKGFGNYINIEMCGRDYDLYFEKLTPFEKKRTIELITDRTVGLVVTLMRQYGIGVDQVLGHYAATASGKSDPGKKYMEGLFLPKLRGRLAAGK